MVENGGHLPDDATRRAAFIEMLPPELSSHVFMQMDSPDFDTYEKVKKWSLKDAKMKQKEKKRAHGNMVVSYDGVLCQCP